MTDHAQRAREIVQDHHTCDDACTCGKDDLASAITLALIQAAQEADQRRVETVAMCDQLRQELQAAQEAEYIPGVWTCRVCGFGLVSTVLYAQSGTCAPNTESTPTCPNDGTLLYRVTYKERLKQYVDALEERLAAPLVWSTEKPTVAGPWWYQQEQGYGCVVETRRDRATGALMAHFTNGRKETVESLRGEWTGPIPFPREA